MKMKIDPKSLLECGISRAENHPSGKVVSSIANLPPSNDESRPNCYEDVMDLCEEIQAQAFDLPEEKVALVISMLSLIRDDLFFGNSLN
jgi:hypothetical protein